MTWKNILYILGVIYSVNIPLISGEVAIGDGNVFSELESVAARAYHEIGEKFLGVVFTDVDGFVNSTFEDVLKKLTELWKKNRKDLDECDWALASVVYGITKKNLWAISMIDSFGKIGSGITRGNVIWPGSFKLCFTVNQSLKSWEEKISPNPVRGQYCWANFALNVAGTPMSLPGVPIPPLQVALCVPDECSPQQIFSLLGIIEDIPGVNKFLNLTSVTFIPQTKDFWGDRSAVTALCICIAFAIIIAIATGYDLYLKYFKFNSSSFRSKRLCNGNKPTTEAANTPHFPQNGIIADNESTSSALSDDSMIITDYELQIYAQQPYNLGLIGRIVLCFSIRRNAYNLFSLRIHEKKLSCLNGIRVLSIIWIVLAQTYVQGSVLVDNLMDVLDILKEMIFQIVAQSIMAVDTFFLLSGLLVTYHYFKHREENDGKISWIRFYFHRYWRLTPLYLFILFLFDDKLINYFGNGPFWPIDGFEGDNCKRNWWWNVLYINNFTPSKHMCMPESWYLANEMQFFIISPLILIPLTYFVPLAALVAGVFLLASWITCGVISAHNKLEAAIDLLKMFPNSDSYYNSLDEYYYKPYCHIGAYIVGICCGWLLIKTKCRAQLKKRWVIIGWILSAACNASLVFGLYKANDHLSVTMMAVYNSLSRTAWAVGIAWVIFACANGYGGAINYILSWPVWQPLGRLTYCVYLIHLMVVNTVFHSMDIAPHFSHQLMLFYSVAIVAICYLAAIGLSLIFEVPFLELEKAVTRRRL